MLERNTKRDGEIRDDSGEIARCEIGLKSNCTSPLFWWLEGVKGAPGVSAWRRFLRKSEMSISQRAAPLAPLSPFPHLTSVSIGLQHGNNQDIDLHLSTKKHEAGLVGAMACSRLDCWFLSFASSRSTCGLRRLSRGPISPMLPLQAQSCF